jgi:hypothetical protein
MVSRCEDKLDSRNFKVDVKKLAQQLEAPLNFTVNGQPAGTTLLVTLLQHLPQEKTVHFEALKQAWKKGVTQIQAETVVEQLWQDIILHPNAPHGVQQSIADFFTNAPTLDEFVSALEDSRYQAPKKKALPAVGKRITVEYDIIQSTHSSYGFKIRVPLKMIEDTNPYGVTLPYVVPVKGELSHASIEVKDSSKSTTIDTLDEFTVGAPKFNYDSSSSSCVSWVTMRIKVTDTIQMRVVEGAKSGSLQIFDLSLDAMNKIKGLTGYNGNMLGAGLKVIADKHGNTKELKGTIKLLGFSFNVYAGEDGVYLTCASPMKFKKEVKLRMDGPDNYSLTISFKVISRPDRSLIWVDTQEGHRGRVNFDTGAEKYEDFSRNLTIELTPQKISIPIKAQD